MRIAVVGTGGVGGYFGGRLAQAEQDVVFLARGAHLRAIQEHGLQVESVDGDFAIRQVHATDDPARIGLVDLVLLAVKGWQVPQAIETMRPLVGSETCVVPFLNGVEAPEQLAATFGTRRVLGGLCGLFGSVVGPGRIRNVFPKPFVTIGELDHEPSERCDYLRQAFEHAGVQASIAADIHAALWEKLLFVGPFGGVGAVTRVPVGVLRRQVETRSLLEGTMREVFVLARARGVRIADEAVEKALALIDLSPEQATASMQRDIMAGRPSELESQLGVVVRLAHLAGVEVPLHTFLYACLLPQERKARGEIEFST
jgi:2-dehydropantoate 2-reductase